VSLRVVALLWLALGVAVWNGFFDLYVSRGAREYNQLRVEHELAREPEPDMTAVMTRAQRDGVEAATLWAALVTASGWATLWIARRRRSS